MNQCETELQRKLEAAKARLDDAEECHKLLLEAKNQWRSRAMAAEAATKSVVTSLKLKAGDVLCIRTNEAQYYSKDQFVDLAEALRAVLPDGVQAVLLPNSVSLTCMDADVMRRAGWVRAEADEEHGT